jgi:hypothetical protein
MKTTWVLGVVGISLLSLDLAQAASRRAFLPTVFYGVGAIKDDPGTDPEYTKFATRRQSEMQRQLGPSGKKGSAFHGSEAHNLKLGVPYTGGGKSVVPSFATACAQNSTKLCCPDRRTPLIQGCEIVTPASGAPSSEHSRWFSIPSAWAAVEFVGREFLEGVLPESSVRGLLGDLVRLGRLDKPSPDSLGGLRSLKTASAASRGLFGLSGKMELQAVQKNVLLAKLEAPPSEGSFHIRVQTDDKVLCDQLTQFLPSARSTAEKQLYEACQSRAPNRPTLVGLGPDPERIVFVLGSFGDTTRVFMRGPTQLSMEEAVWLSRLGAIAEESEIPEI